MKQIFYLAILLLICTNTVNAQSNFRSGYIIKANGDTLNGYISYKGNKFSAKKCLFKTNTKSDKQEFSPHEIHAYRFNNGKYYVSKTLSISTDTAVFHESLFMEYLINGIVDIYYYSNSTGKHYFIEKDGELIELINREHEVLLNDKKYLKESKEYIGTLKTLMSDSPETTKKIDNTYLSHQSLINIASSYHTQVCDNETCIVYQKDVNPNFDFGLIGGMNLLSISGKKTVSSSSYYLNNFKSETTTYPTIGILIKYRIPYINDRIHLQLESTIGRYSIDIHDLYVYPSSSLRHISDITLSQSDFKNAISIRYEFPGRILKPNIHIGGFYSYFFNNSFYRHLTVEYATGEFFYEEEYDDNPFTNSDGGVIVGTGCTIPLGNRFKLNTDIRYQYGVGILQSVYSHQYSINIGILLRN